MPCYSQDNAPDGYIAKFPDGPTYESEEDCLDACAEGACCETDGTCNIKPQCECDTDNGAVFAGVGEGCEVCKTRYCACEEFNFFGSTVTVNIRNLSFVSNPRYPPTEGYSEIHAGCSESDILSQAILGPYEFPFFGWKDYGDGLRAFPNAFLAPTWQPEQIAPTFYSRIEYICRSSGNALNNRLTVSVQEPLFGRLPCQQDYNPGTPNGAILQPFDNYFYFTNYYFGSFPNSSDLFCRLISGETVTIQTAAPQTGVHAVRIKNSLFPDYPGFGVAERGVTCTFELSLNPLP